MKKFLSVIEICMCRHHRLSRCVCNGLEVDEKLTLRILNVSNSKKTMLINRGLEDGLAVGDHAKFYLTTGIVSRGVIVKTSPSRSIWSLYRVVDNEQLALDKVMNLKISAPVKLSQDKTKCYRRIVRRACGHPLAPGAEDAVVDKNLSPEDKEDLAAFARVNPATSVDELPGLAREKSLEVWGIMHFTVYRHLRMPGLQEHRQAAILFLIFLWELKIFYGS